MYFFHVHFPFRRLYGNTVNLCFYYSNFKYKRQAKTLYLAIHVLQRFRLFHALKI
nr:MAG TPA: hypothetical protein [Caudoviricetes sp.]